MDVIVVAIKIDLYFKLNIIKIFLFKRITRIRSLF